MSLIDTGCYTLKCEICGKPVCYFKNDKDFTHDVVKVLTNARIACISHLDPNDLFLEKTKGKKC